MRKKTLISNIIKLNDSFIIKAAEDMSNGLLGLKYSYIQLNLQLVPKHEILLVLNENVLVVGTMSKVRKV